MNKIFNWFKRPFKTKVELVVSEGVYHVSVGGIAMQSTFTLNKKEAEDSYQNALDIVSGKHKSKETIIKQQKI